MYLIKAITHYQTKRSNSQVSYTATASSSASAAIETATANLDRVNNAILTAIRESQTVAINAQQGDSMVSKNLGDSTTNNASTTEFVTSTGSSSTPWYGGVINGYFMWQGNFVNFSPTTQYFAGSVSAPQTYTDETNSNIVASFGAYNYSSNVTPSGTGTPYNAIFQFSGNSNAQAAINSNINYTTGTNNYTTAQNYFTSNGVTKSLMCLTIGGGYNVTGSWNAGSAGAMYSVYQVVTKKGVAFSYKETGTGNTLSGTGTGTLYPDLYNSICFDIETWGAGPGDTSYGSTGQDFLNICAYIKTNINSTYYLDPSLDENPCIIIMTVAHSCSNYNGTGYDTISTLLSDTTGCYDYFSPQLYTENIGTTTEYTQNSNLSWSQFNTFLSKNANYQKHGSGFILPALNYLGLLNNGGTNDGNPPNLYWYQSSDSGTNPPVFTAAGATEAIEYTVDTGAENFFNAILGVTETLGGSIQWVNGTLKQGVIEYPYPWAGGQVAGLTLWNSSLANSAQYYFNSVTAQQSVAETSSNLTTKSGTFTYSSTNISTGTNVIHLYTNYSNAQSAVTASGVNTSTAPFLTAYNYFNKSSFSGKYILSLALGGSTSNGSWDTGSSGAIYSIYKAATKSGVGFSYKETGTGVTLSGTGTGALNNNFNGLLFDIQQYASSGSSAQDFLNLFQYIKYNGNSTFSGFQMVITVAFLHSGPFWGGSGSAFMSTILADGTGNASGKYSYDLLAPEFFTQSNLGSMNEYCAGVIPWTTFLSYAQENANFNTFNVNMITPLLVSSNLSSGPGSNTTGFPNNYWYQSTSTNVNPPTATASGYVTINYTTDTGATAFFNTVLGSGVTSTGGYVQWMNGTLT